MKKILNQAGFVSQKVWDIFTAPFEKLPRMEDARRARVATAFLLLSAASVGVEQLMAGNTPRLALFMLILGYLLARTRWYKYATFLLVIALTFPSYLVAFRLPDPDPNRILAAFSWVIIPILLSSLMFSVRTASAINLLNIIAISLLPFVRPELTYTVLSGTMGFFILTSTIVLIVMIQRNQIENDRQQELHENQERLQQEIIEKIHTQQEREQLIKELEVKNTELERFNYTISHELRSPIVTIKGFLGIIEKAFHENNYEQAEKDFRRITNAADKMQATLSDLLELSRIGRIINPTEEIDLAELIKESIETVDGRIRAKNITIHVAPDLPTLYADRIRLREVLENLIDNAAKYTGNQPNPIIEIGTRNQTGEQVIYVKDNGLGIDPQYLTKIFGLFEKLDPGSEGTGIGLALIKRIVEIHEGKIWVESDGLGKGSTFCFTIPYDKNG